MTCILVGYVFTLHAIVSVLAQIWFTLKQKLTHFDSFLITCLINLDHLNL